MFLNLHKAGGVDNHVCPFCFVSSFVPSKSILHQRDSAYKYIIKLNELSKKAICAYRRFFSKIVIRKGIGKRWYDDSGILNINVIGFLLDKNLI